MVPASRWTGGSRRARGGPARYQGAIGSAITAACGVRTALARRMARHGAHFHWSLLPRGNGSRSQNEARVRERRWSRERGPRRQALRRCQAPRIRRNHERVLSVSSFAGPKRRKPLRQCSRRNSHRSPSIDSAMCRPLLAANQRGLWRIRCPVQGRQRTRSTSSSKPASSSSMTRSKRRTLGRRAKPDAQSQISR